MQWLDRCGQCRRVDSLGLPTRLGQRCALPTLPTALRRGALLPAFRSQRITINTPQSGSTFGVNRQRTHWNWKGRLLWWRMCRREYARKRGNGSFQLRRWNICSGWYGGRGSPRELSRCQCSNLRREEENWVRRSFSDVGREKASLLFLRLRTTSGCTRPGCRGWLGGRLGLRWGAVGSGSGPGPPGG